jgi:hypothetical protein
MTLRRALPLLAALTVLTPVGSAAAGGFIFAIAGGGIVAAGSGAGAAAVAGLGLVMSQGGYQRPWPPEPSLFLVEAMPLDAEITLNGKAAGTARERGSYPLRLPPGLHTITIEAPGHQPLTRRFIIDGSGYMAKVRVVLAPAE